MAELPDLAAFTSNTALGLDHCVSEEWLSKTKSWHNSGVYVKSV